MSGLKLKIKHNDPVKSNHKSDFEQELDNIFGTDENEMNSFEEKEIQSEKPLNKANLTLHKFDSDEEAKFKNKSKKKKVNKYFYKVSNHHELFKIGRSFYQDYMNGVKSFAITSTGYQSSQQNTILGLASFFDHKDDIRIGIVSDNIHEGAFRDIVSISKKQKMPISVDSEMEIYSFYNHFEFIDLNYLLELSNNQDVEGYDELFDNVVDYYDIVFWDVPELHKIQLESEIYFPVIMKFESLSIIVAQTLTSSKDIDNVKEFFLGYGINLKGLLLEKNVQSSSTKTRGGQSDLTLDSKNKKGGSRPWWRFGL